MKYILEQLKTYLNEKNARKFSLTKFTYFAARDALPANKNIKDDNN